MIASAPSLGTSCASFIPHFLISIEITESVHSGDSHFCHWIASGSVPATGKSFTVTGMTMHQFKDGMMTEEWAYFDAASIQAQLNAEAVTPTR